MSRSMLCLLTALALAVASVGLMACRRHALGSEAGLSSAPGTWRVRMLISGKTSAADARIQSLTPLDFGKQHIVREDCRSDDLISKPPDVRHPQRRQVLWSPRSGRRDGPFRALYEFYCTIDVRHPSPAMNELERSLYRPPVPGEDLEIDSRGPDNERVTAQARRLAGTLERPADVAEALYRYVDLNIANEPSTGLPAYSAADCLRHGLSDCGGKSRLLVALLRIRGIPARLVTGITLAKGPEQVAHIWVEAWIHDHWLPMCPFYHHYGRVPATYLVLGMGDQAIARGRHVHDLDYAFLIEHMAPPGSVEDGSTLKRAFQAASLYHLPPAEQRLVEFLLLLPIAALMVCIYRNLIGLDSFGTFAPALVGLAFRDWHSLPGMAIFVSIVLIGWLMRRVLNYYHLLQVPRTAFLLSLVIILLILTVVAGNHQNPPIAATQYISLFPMVILTGMIERFWTLENEDGAFSSLRTLVGTMAIAASIALVLSMRSVVHHMFRYPETLGIIMAVQLLLGRYTGYKLSELWRFREFTRFQEA